MIQNSNHQIRLFFITAMLLSSLLIMHSIPVKAVPNPIYGQAIKSDGSSADGAYVLVTNSTGYSVHTFVGLNGGWSSGWWQVDIGDPGSSGKIIYMYF